MNSIASSCSESISTTSTTTGKSVMLLENMKNKIETMTKSHHIEILRILRNDPSIKINENKNGIFVNLSFLSQSVIDEIQKYVEYIDMQENSIMSLETMKEGYKNTYFVDKDNKDITMSYNNLCSK